MHDFMKATLHVPGQPSQSVAITENTLAAAAELMGLLPAHVGIMFESRCPVNGCTIYINATTNPNLSWDKYTASHPFLLVKPGLTESINLN